MIIVKSTTKRGQALLARAENYEGYYLKDVYKEPSIQKEIAWMECFSMFKSCEGATGFGICSHNTFTFSVSWCDFHGMHLITPTNHYYVLYSNH